MARSRYKFLVNNEPHFLTCTIINWLPLFADPAIVKILLDSLTFLRGEDRMTIYAYVIMENHLHLIASSKNLSKEIGDFKSYTARGIVDFLKERKSYRLLRELKFHKLSHKRDREHQVWQEGSHPELIYSDAMMQQKIEYIHYNPVRRGYVDDPVHWRYSSARNYAGMEAVLDITMEW